MKLDDLVKSIVELSYPDLRILSESLNDMLRDKGAVNLPDDDVFAGMLFDFSEGWEREAEPATPESKPAIAKAA